MSSTHHSPSRDTTSDTSPCSHLSISLPVCHSTLPRDAVASEGADAREDTAATTPTASATTLHTGCPSHPLHFLPFLHFNTPTTLVHVVHCSPRSSEAQSEGRRRTPTRTEHLRAGAHGAAARGLPAAQPPLPPPTHQTRSSVPHSATSAHTGQQSTSSPDRPTPPPPSLIPFSLSLPPRCVCAACSRLLTQTLDHRNARSHRKRTRAVGGEGEADGRRQRPGPEAEPQPLRDDYEEMMAKEEQSGEDNEG